MEFPAAVFTKHVSAQQRYVQVLCTEFHADQTKSGFHCAEFHKTYIYLTFLVDIFCTEFYSHRTVNVSNTFDILFMPLKVKYDFHCTNFYQTHACWTTFFIKNSRTKFH
jgi:hypothetical protein